MQRFAKRTSLLLLVSLLLSSFTAPINTQARSGAVTRQAEDDKKEQGLHFRLSEAADQPAAPTATRLVTTTMLSELETQTILKRMAPIKAESSDEKSFALRERSLPPPRTGQTISVSFPPANNVAPSEAAAAGALEILRYSPEGAIPLAPNLSITFSQPMTSVGAQAEAAENVPVRLSPQPPGKWRWIGARTLLFEPDGRFPMATQYSVSVAAGTKSANGGILPANKTWSFTTPPPKIKQSYPGHGTQARDSLMFIEFDQRIDPAMVLKTININVDATRIPARLATKQEIESDEDVLKLTRQAEKDRWLVFRALDPKTGDSRLGLPGNSIINVFVEPGTSSAEGPLVSSERQQFSFVTYGPLRLSKSKCGVFETHECTPYDALYFEFNNAIREDQPIQVAVEPKIENLSTIIGGNTLSLMGTKKSNTTYRVTLDKSVVDQFDQTLGKDETVTFKTGPLPSLISLAGQGFAVLDPGGRHELTLYTRNFRTVKISLYKVEPQDWFQFNVYRRLHYHYADNAVGQKQQLPGRLVSVGQIEFKDTADELLETPIDLQPALSDGLGQVLVAVEAINPVADANRNPQLAWVQSTKIGLDAFVDNDSLVGWANSLTDGVPLSNVEMQILPAGASGHSGVDGLIKLALKPAADSAESLLVARRGNDVAILPEGPENWWNSNGQWHHKPLTDELRWYVFDDRKLYRPGEEVHLKGWVRRVGTGSLGDVGPLNGAVHRLSYSVTDEADNEVGKGELTLNPFGGFDTVCKLPPTMNLGDATVKFAARDSDDKLGERGFEHRFQVQEFRRPEFEVTAKTESAASLFVGSGAEVSVAANYFAGGGLANATVDWKVHSSPTNFTPPNRDDYTFGKWTRWWRDDESDDETNSEELSGRTDANGKHRLHIDFDSVNPPRPSLVTAEANVEDVNRQSWSSSATLLVHPAKLYVGLKSDRTFVQQGEPLVVQSIVTDLEGRIVGNQQLRMRVGLLEWKQEKGEWKQIETIVQDSSVRSEWDVDRLSFTPKQGGTYRVTATVRDDRGRANESELTLWVAGGKRPPKTAVEEEEVELIPDRKEYKAGDTAEILAQAPFYPAEAVMTLRRSGIIRTERFRFDGPSHTLRVPIEEGWTPNVHLQVDLVGAADRATGSDSANTGTAGSGTAGVSPASSAANENAAAKVSSSPSKKAGGTPAVPVTAVPVKRPGFASGELNLSIPPVSRKLNVTATARDKTLEPGGNTIIDVTAADANGKAVKDSEVAVVVVDESVLTLINYRLEDPLGVFYIARESETSDYHSRKNVLVAASGAGSKFGSGGDGSVNAMMQTVETNNYSAGGLRDRVFDVRAISSLPRRHRVAKGDFDAEYGVNGGVMLRVVTKSGTSGEKSITVRLNFNALAVFAPTVRTDASGRAQVQVKLPDNLTRYRVMAVAVAGGKQFGTGESAITARLPLMARPSAPRFLNFGDRFELPIVIQNQTGSAITVDLVVRATNALLGTGSPGSAGVPPATSPSARAGKPVRSTLNATDRMAGGTPAVPVTPIAATGRRVSVPANDRVEVRIPAAAARPGTARFQIAAVSGNWSDAAEIELPVWTPATTEAFATYGEIDQGAITQPVKAPANIFAQFGGLEIETSSTQLQQLTDAFLYLQNYPYECSEQLSSRIISVAALRDVLGAFKTKDLPSPKEIEAAVTRDLKRLQSMQNGDGGFGFWQRGEKSWPYLSIHVAHALARARQKKFAVPQEMFEQSQKYLREIETHIPADYGDDARRALIAYALYVRAQMADRDPLRARKLIADEGLEKLSLESVGWLLSVLANNKDSFNELAAMRRLLSNRVTETAGMAHFVCSYRDSDYLLLNSDRRADGIILEALIDDQPTSDLIPKIVRGLLDHRTRGRWENTQENVFILLALDRYFNTFEKATPNFVARVWLGNAYAGEQQFKGRSTDRQQLNVPMKYLVASEKGVGKVSAESAGQNLILSKAGPGRLYYRIGMNYAPQDLNLKAADYGFTVARTYEALDDAADVRQVADGTWHIKAGARVRVRLTMVAPARRYHVALVDPLPAGFESLNPALATTAAIPDDKQQTSVAEYGNRSYGNYGWWSWRSVWFDHQNLRDERAEAFTPLLWEGVYNYAYVARATTPGVFTVPPAKAEEMYHPETFGRGKTDHVVIE